MANINKSGLYVVIKNVDQLKKTITIINTLKAGKDITLHFATEMIDGEKRNFLRINEDGINDSVAISVQHELYADEDKYKCLDDPAKYKVSYSNVCVESKILYDIFKSVNNNFTVIFYQYLNESSLRISISNNSTFSQELKIATIDPVYDDNSNIKYKTACCVMMKTKTLNDNIKLYNKFGEDIVLMCSNNSLTFESPHTAASTIESTSTLTKGDNPDDIVIKPGKSIVDADKMIIKSTYPMKCMMLVSKVDDQFCDNVTVLFINTTVANNYAVVFNYTFDKNEFVKITILPKNSRTNDDENSEQINY